jgi:hypothetical protein
MAAALVTLAAVAEQQKPGQEFDMEAMAKAWIEFAKLAPQHEAFKHVVGQWKAETTESWPGMDKPNVSTGTAVCRLMMDGRFLQQRYESEYHGTKFRGLGIYGYDKSKKKYFCVWLDNLSTGPTFSEGEYDTESDQLVLEGEVASPMGNMPTRSVIKPVDDDTLTMTYDVAHKTMVTTYTRQK